MSKDLFLHFVKKEMLKKKIWFTDQCCIAWKVSSNKKRMGPLGGSVV